MANMMDFKGVTEKCSLYLERQLTKQNCLQMYCFADMHSLVMLKHRSMDCLLDNFMDVYEQVRHFSFFFFFLFGTLNSHEHVI